jgi:glycosyl hydrolase family 62
MSRFLVFLLLTIPLAGADIHWRAEPSPLLTRGSAGSFDDVSVKDPTIVEHEGKWHLFYTAFREPLRPPSIGYASAATIAGLAAARRRQIPQLAGSRRPYAAAPQVFFFAPQQTWYLIYQTQDHPGIQPVYATTKTIDDPASWSPPRNLVSRHEDARWIDFWVICDDDYAYLFYSRTQRDIYMRKTKLAEFPSGWGPHRHILDTPIKEAVHVYKVHGRDEFHLFYEAGSHPNKTRYFGQAWAPSLDGPWTHITDSYATGDQIAFPAGAKPWTDIVSHGEAIRAGYNQRLEYLEDARWLIQGLRREVYSGPYQQLPWVIGLIEPVMKALPSGADIRNLNQAAYIDPHYGGSTDPEIIWNPDAREWLIYYTGRRSQVPGTAVGCPIGVAASSDGKSWEFRGYCTFDGIGGTKDAPHTYWAPGVIRDGNMLHMFVTYKEKNTGNWGGGDNGIMHYEAPVTDPVDGWKKVGWVDATRDNNIIDATLANVGGHWRMWTKYRAQTGLFTSTNLRNWTDRGVLADQPQNEHHNVEGPYIFRWKNAWWMITDPHNGIQVYRSEDATNWKHNATILAERGRRMLDQTRARHPSVAVARGRAFIVYHVEPFRPYPKSVPMPRLPANMKRCVIQIAELTLDDTGRVTCDRDKPAVLPLPED